MIIPSKLTTKKETEFEKSIKKAAPGPMARNMIELIAVMSGALKLDENTKEIADASARIAKANFVMYFGTNKMSKTDKDAVCGNLLNLYNIACTSSQRETASYNYNYIPRNNAIKLATSSLDKMHAESELVLKSAIQDIYQLAAENKKLLSPEFQRKFAKTLSCTP